MENLELHWQAVLLVLAVVAAVKRHVPQLKNYKTVLLALGISVALTYDHQLPAWLEPLKDGVMVFCYAIGGHAYLGRVLAKLGVKVPAEVQSALETTVWVDEPTTKTDGDTLPAPPAVPETDEPTDASAPAKEDKEATDE